MKIRIKKVPVYITLLFLTFLCLFPFLILFINSTRSHPDIQKGFSIFFGKSGLVNLVNVFNNPNLPVFRAMFNSFFIATMIVILATYFSSITAYGIHAYKFKGHKTAFTTILLVMMVPMQVSALGFLRLMMSMGLRDSYVGLILPAIAAPTIVFFMKQYMVTAVPLEIVEAARIDGANEFYAYNRIILPIMLPAFAVQGIFAFVGSWNNYFMPALLIDSPSKKTLPILIATLRGADFLKFDMGQVYMLITLAILPTIIVYIIMSRHIIGGIAVGGVKS